jgi:hypothetical protein
MATLVLVMGWIIAILIGFLGLIVAWKILIGKIDLQFLISEDNGHASLSRFQFLIFTFVIAGGLLLFIIHAIACSNCTQVPAFPAIPGSILALLGISSGSYVTAKGIQTSKEVSMGTGDGNAGGGTDGKDGAKGQG